MNQNDVLAFAFELLDHLQIRMTEAVMSPEITSDLDILTKLEDEIHRQNLLFEEAKNQIEVHKKQYQIFNFRYGLGKSYSDFEITKKQRSESWESIAKAEINRDDLYATLRDLRVKRDQISIRVGHFRKQFNETAKFFNRYESQISLFSITMIKIENESLKFILASEVFRQNVFSLNLDIISIESPLGQSCLGKQIGDLISYRTPNGRMVTGEIINFESPLIEQIEKMIVEAESRPSINKGERLNPFYLQNNFGTNNSRYRKGG